MRIILKDPTLVFTAIIGVIFSIAMVMLLMQMMGETEDIRKIWTEMSCPELKEFYTSSEFQALGEEESTEFKKALDACRET